MDEEGEGIDINNEREDDKAIWYDYDSSEDSTNDFAKHYLMKDVLN